jgi:hypothetical protein
VDARESGRLLLVDIDVLERERRLSVAMVGMPSGKDSFCLHQNKVMATAMGKQQPNCDGAKRIDGTWADSAMSQMCGDGCDGCLVRGTVALVLLILFVWVRDPRRTF